MGVQTPPSTELNSMITCIPDNVYPDFTWVISDVFFCAYLGTGTVFSVTPLNLNLKEFKVSFILKLK